MAIVIVITQYSIFHCWKCALSLVLIIWKLLALSTGLSKVSFLCQFFHFSGPLDVLTLRV